MDSCEDRIKAVWLYMKLGKRLGVTIRQLCYPTKNTLIGCYREFIDKQALRDGYTLLQGRFTVEQKLHAVQHLLDHVFVTLVEGVLEVQQGYHQTGGQTPPPATSETGPNKSRSSIFLPALTWRAQR